MRLSFQLPSPQTPALGISLIELGMTMLIVSLAVIPVVKSIGGPTSNNGNGSALQLSGIKNKETVLATSLANQVLGADYSSLTCGTGSANTLPSGSAETYKICQASGGVDLVYQWSVKPVTEAKNGTELPSDNSFYRGMLNVYKGSDEASLKSGKNPTPLLSMPLSFFRHTAKPVKPDNRDTGVLIALDRSASMLWAGTDGGKDMPGWDVLKITDPRDPDYKLTGNDLIFFGMPYLWYRYKNFPTPNTTTNWGYKFPTVTSAVTTPLDKWNNKTLDMVYLQNYKNQPDTFDPNPATPNNEQYLGGQASIPCAVTLDNKWKWGDNNFDKRLAYIFNKDWVLNNSDIAKKTRSEYIQPLCQEKDNRIDWRDTINEKLSRFEAARSAALSLLLILEDRPAVRDAIELGFFPWAGIINTPGKVFDAKLEKPSLARKKFETVRERLLWINRMDPADKDSKYAIDTAPGTRIFQALQHAEREFKAPGKNFKRRIVILMTDGQPAPNEGWNSNAPKGQMGLRQYAFEKIGCGAPKEDQITLFTVGLINADELLMKDMALATPDGEDFFAKDISDLSPIFESVAYQIQKLTLLNTSERYQLEIADGVDASCDPAL